MTADTGPGDSADLWGLDALPYGVFSLGGHEPRRVGVRLGDRVFDLGRLSARADLSAEVLAALGGPSLDALLELGRPAWTEVRDWLRSELAGRLGEDGDDLETAVHQLRDVHLHLPFQVADYVDFYASEHHASNVGRLFRPDQEPLPPNWRYLPVGYHGRAGTIRVSGSPVVRPRGQFVRPGESAPVFGPTERLDVEVELGFVLGGRSSAPYAPIPLAEADAFVFGVLLLNDWSARDIQSWETRPLGPFLGKSFATSVSAWVLPMDALADARIELPAQVPTPPSYLVGPRQGIDIRLELAINGTTVSRPTYRDMYWTPEQLVAHLTVNGATIRPGDLLGSGTISGPGPDSLGSLLELTRGGAEPIRLGPDERRGFLVDGDEVVISAWAPAADGRRIGLGEVRGRVEPSR